MQTHRISRQVDRLTDKCLLCVCVYIYLYVFVYTQPRMAHRHTKERQCCNFEVCRIVVANIGHSQYVAKVLQREFGSWPKNVSRTKGLIEASMRQPVEAVISATLWVQC